MADDRVRTRVERAVVDLLVENTESPALEKEPVAAYGDAQRVTPP